MKSWIAIGFILVFSLFALAEDWTLKNGTVYEKVKTGKPQVKGLLIYHKFGVVTVPYDQLPDSILEKYGPSEEEKEKFFKKREAYEKKSLVIIKKNEEEAKKKEQEEKFLSREETIKKYCERFKINISKSHVDGYTTYNSGGYIFSGSFGVDLLCHRSESGKASLLIDFKYFGKDWIFFKSAKLKWNSDSELVVSAAKQAIKKEDVMDGADVLETLSCDVSQQFEYLQTIVNSNAVYARLYGDKDCERKLYEEEISDIKNMFELYKYLKDPNYILRISRDESSSGKSVKEEKRYWISGGKAHAVWCSRDKSGYYSKFIPKGTPCSRCGGPRG